MYRRKQGFLNSAYGALRCRLSTTTVWRSNTEKRQGHPGFILSPVNPVFLFPRKANTEHMLVEQTPAQGTFSGADTWIIVLYPNW